jgi:hypothetical protein
VLNSPGHGVKLLKYSEALGTRRLKVAAVAWLYSPRIPWLFVDVGGGHRRRQTNALDVTRQHRAEVWICVSEVCHNSPASGPTRAALIEKERWWFVASARQHDVLAGP